MLCQQTNFCLTLTPRAYASTCLNSYVIWTQRIRVLNVKYFQNAWNIWVGEYGSHMGESFNKNKVSTVGVNTTQLFIEFKSRSMFNLKGNFVV